MRPCDYRDIFGKSGEGIHKYRIPGTDTAAIDYIATLLLAWAISAKFKTSLVLTSIVLFLVAMICHWLFCVNIGNI